LFVIRKNKFNNFVFKDTPYIFQSATEKYIVAKEGIKGEWIPLNDEDKRICRKQYHLRCKDIDFNKQTSIDMTFIQENIKLPYEESSETKKSKPTGVDWMDRALESGYYVVKPGDQLLKIAMAHGLTLDYIMNLNDLTHSGDVHPGDKLAIR
jgi:hypothetical protein